MRELQTNDLFNAARIIKKLKLKEEFSSAVQLASAEKRSEMQLGFDLMYIVIDKVTDEHVEKEFYQFLAEPFEVPAEEIAKMKPIDLINGLKEIAKPEEWADFFGNLRRLAFRKS